MSDPVLTAPQKRRIPRSRALVCDVLKLHRDVPTTAQDRLISLAQVAEARTQCSARISWPAIFLKSYSAVCQRHPELRQVWCDWPLPHLVEFPSPVATVAVQRTYQEEDWLFWGRIRAPHELLLIDLQQQIDRFVEGPVDEVFRQQLQLSGLPSFLRRVIWWWNLNLAGAKRAKRLGTFLLTTVAGRGAEISHPPCFLTSGLTYGPLDERGQCRATLAYDHRLMDGAFVADCLLELEHELHNAILTELREHRLPLRRSA